MISGNSRKSERGKRARMATRAAHAKVRGDEKSSKERRENEPTSGGLDRSNRERSEHDSVSRATSHGGGGHDLRVHSRTGRIHRRVVHACRTVAEASRTD